MTSCCEETCLDRLHEDHLAFRRVLDETEIALGAAETGRVEMGPLRRFLSMLETDVREHAKKEDGHLFPAMKARMGSDCQPVLCMAQEHAQLEVLIEEYRRDLSRLIAHEGGALSTLARTARQIIGLLDDHMGKEERVLFPLARDLLGVEGLKALTEECEGAHGRERAHGHVR